MATRSTRDPALMRRLDATLELARDALDAEGVTRLIAAAEREMTAQADGDLDTTPWNAFWADLHACAG